MILDANSLYSGLIQHGLFPVQKKSKEELPPLFSSENITINTANEIQKVDLCNRREKSGFDTIEYSSTRYNNVPRIFSIPHPKAHIDLAWSFKENFNNIQQGFKNERSLILPKKHLDGRIIIMDYESQWKNRTRTLKMEFAKKFIVKTDISNCFPSIYSHSIGWALVGTKNAKNNRNPELWYNVIDKAQRLNKRNETSGIPIGPATSNITAEIILGKIDNDMSEQFSYVRFIDDYTAYCDTYEQAESFLRILNTNLSKYKLSLNINKTSINKSPLPISDAWIGELKRLIPNKNNITAAMASDILDAALRLQKIEPGGSILKFAIKSLSKKVTGYDVYEFLSYLFKLSFHYPILITILKMPLKSAYEQNLFRNTGKTFEDELKKLLDHSIIHRRSDSICWILYYLSLYHPNVSDEIADEIIKTADSLSISLLAIIDDYKHENKALEFAQSLNIDDIYNIDQNWILFYQLFKRGKIDNPYINIKCSEDCFDILKNSEVEFVKPPSVS